MGAIFGVLTCITLCGGSTTTDTSTYADRATQLLVARAIARHAQQDTGVREYTAKLRYRLSFGFARRKWGEPLPVAVEEQDALLTWQLPNDMRIDMLGRREVSRMSDVDLTSTFSHPWFVPRSLGDSLRIFGARQTPEEAAPHPLAAGADRFYRYAAGDSIRVTIAGRSITIRTVVVTPKLTKGSWITGRLWLDEATGDVVRFAFQFVGTTLWSTPDTPSARDSASAERENRFVSRIFSVSADIEYAFEGGEHWLPYQEVIAGTVSAPLGIDFAVPFEARTTFDDYVVNSGARVTFDVPLPRDSGGWGRNRGRLVVGDENTANASTDTLRPRRDSLYRNRARRRVGYLAGGGRYEIRRPPLDSMKAYHGWGDSLVLLDTPADQRRLRQTLVDLENLSAKLPPEMTGRPTLGFAWEHLSDILRYNRVEGTALSAAGRLPLPLTFADLYGTLRYGFGDQRVMARLALVRDAPSGELTLAAMRDLEDADPFAQGLTLGNSVRAIFTGHDEGAYLLAQGARLGFQVSRGPGTEITWRLRAENESSVGNGGRAWFPRLFGADGYFPPNDSVRSGFTIGGGARVEHSGVRARWMMDVDAGDVRGDPAARLAINWRPPVLAGGWASLRFNGGVAAGADSVPQLALRAGGLNTVRGYDFGAERGDLLWSVQLDVSKPGHRGIRPVAFADIGEAGWMSDYAATPLLSGAGIGASVLGGLLRADLSYPLRHRNGHGVRFDITMGSIR